MPRLSDFRKTKEISLINYPDSKIVIYGSLLARDIDFSRKVDEPSFKLSDVAKFIKEWNFVDENGKSLEINADNIGLLDSDSIGELMTKVNELNKEVKKN